MVWTMRSSTPLKKAISATAVLITQAGAAVSGEERNEEASVGRGSSLTGTMVNLFVDIENILTLVVQTKAMVCATIFL